MTRRRGSPASGALPALAAVVLAAAGGCGDEATGPEYVADLLLEPDSVYLEPGESAVFTAVPMGPREQPFPDRTSRVEWALSSSDLLDMEITAPGELTVTAVAVGNAEVHATLGRGEGSAPVYVQPPGLASIEIVPSSMELFRFTARQVRAVLRDENGQEISPAPYRLSWWSGNEDVLYVVPNTRFMTPVTVSGRQPGTALLRLKVGRLIASATVTVHPH